jgi:hypothetical protein
MLNAELECWTLSRKWARNASQEGRSPGASECPSESLCNINQKVTQVKVKDKRFVHCPCLLSPLMLCGYCAFCKSRGLCHKVAQQWCGTPGFLAALCRCRFLSPLSTSHEGFSPATTEAEAFLHPHPLPLKGEGYASALPVSADVKMNGFKCTHCSWGLDVGIPLSGPMWFSLKVVHSKVVSVPVERKVIIVCLHVQSDEWAFYLRPMGTAPYTDLAHCDSEDYAEQYCDNCPERGVHWNPEGLINGLKVEEDKT